MSPTRISAGTCAELLGRVGGRFGQMLRSIADEDEQDVGDVKKLLNSAEAATELSEDAKSASAPAPETAGGAHVVASSDRSKAGDGAPGQRSSGEQSRAPANELLNDFSVAPPALNSNSHALEPEREALKKPTDSDPISSGPVPVAANDVKRHGSSSVQSANLDAARLVSDEDTASGVFYSPSLLFSNEFRIEELRLRVLYFKL